MNLPESILSALHNLAAHKLRSILTMLGMIFGVGAVDAALMGLNPRPHLLILAGLLVGSGFLCPLAAAAGLRLTLE